MSLEVAAFGFGHDFFMVWVTAKVLCDFFFFITSKKHTDSQKLWKCKLVHKIRSVGRKYAFAADRISAIEKTREHDDYIRSHERPELPLVRSHTVSVSSSLKQGSWRWGGWYSLKALKPNLQQDRSA